MVANLDVERESGHRVFTKRGLEFKLVAGQGQLHDGASAEVYERIYQIKRLSNDRKERVKVWVGYFDPEQVELGGRIGWAQAYVWTDHGWVMAIDLVQNKLAGADSDPYDRMTNVEALAVSDEAYLLQEVSALLFG